MNSWVHDTIRHVMKRLRGIKPVPGWKYDQILRDFEKASRRERRARDLMYKARNEKAGADALVQTACAYLVIAVRQAGGKLRIDGVALKNEINAPSPLTWERNAETGDVDLFFKT